MPTFVTLTEVYESFINNYNDNDTLNNKTLKENSNEAVIKFRPDAIVDVTLDKYDIISSPFFTKIIDIPDHNQKIEMLKELILQLMNDKIKEVNEADPPLNVNISCSYNFKDVTLYRTSLEDIIQEYQNDQKEDLELS